MSESPSIREVLDAPEVDTAHPGSRAATSGTAQDPGPNGGQSSGTNEPTRTNQSADTSPPAGRNQPTDARQSTGTAAIAEAGASAGSSAPATSPAPQPGPPADGGHQGRAPLFPDQRAGELRGRWEDVQAGFVDAPRQAVEQADGLVAEVMQQLASTFARERSDLEGQWSHGQDVSTEDLRQALRRYRSFFDRLLSL